MEFEGLPSGSLATTPRPNIISMLDRHAFLVEGSYEDLVMTLFGMRATRAFRRANAPVRPQNDP